ncbi:glycosyltransferase [Chitinimonas sp.]|uniref:glycosyltransferase n=1 Tax=Chitinimonas sp. TaxID=1934313 RepID=UPI002F95ED95
MRIVAFPHRGIAYNDAFYAALEQQGVEVVTGEWAGRWLLHSLQPGDIVHIHWPSFLYISHGGYLLVLRRFCRFLFLLLLARWRAGALWWTAHNLLPHERCVLPALDVLARQVVIRLSQRILVHGAEAEAILCARFPAVAGKCVRIPHGNWIDHYPPAPDKTSARAELGLAPGAYVYLQFGQCKPYKNLEGLIEAFARYQAEDAVLLIAGSFADKGYLAQIGDMAAKDTRVRLDARYLPDELLVRYLSACDVVCMPYREILTSGTAMLALSLGRPVLSVNRGFLHEVITPEVGLLVEPGDQAALVAALAQVRTRRWDEATILAEARRYTFADAAAICLKAAQWRPGRPLATGVARHEDG